MAAIIQRWKRVMAAGCTHGDLADPERLRQALEFRKSYCPEIVFDLGDVMDTAAFRSGARGTKDESQPVEPDNLAAVDWILAYQPTHIAWGNHDWRLVKWQGHYNATLSYAASVVWRCLTDAAKQVGAKTVPYHITKGWFRMGGTFWGHGYMYNESAVRDHAEMLGGPVVMAHLHRPEEVRGRTVGGSASYCVGTLADIDKMTYADERRSKTRWGAGIVWGEVSDKESHLWLTRAEPGKPLIFPPGI